ncbi:MAG: TPM domain-containing protein [Clostridia bacterium]|nr:TPM domain-containing protein [Clostridia bacterium]
MRKSLFLCLSLLLVAALLLPISAETHPAVPYNIKVFDTVGFLTESEETMLAAEAGGDTHGVAFYLVTSRTRLTDTRVNAICGIGAKNAVVLVIDGTKGDYYYEMFTFNGADDLFSDGDVDDILDADSVYDNIKYGSLYTGCASFFDLCQQTIADEIASQNAFPWYAVIAGAIGGVLIGGITALCVFLFYRKKRHGVSYPLDRYATLDLTDGDDRFVGSFVTRVRVQSNSSGGGRSGGFSGGSRGRR